MRTYQPTNLKPKTNLSLLDINIGSVIEINDAANSRKKRFIVVGMSLSDYAFVSAFEKDPYATTLKKYNLHTQEVSLPLNKNNNIPLYADCTKVFVRRFGELSNWLKKYPESYVGNIGEEETKAILNHIRMAKMISSRIKNEFFH
jgi:hypothetical protein